MSALSQNKWAKKWVIISLAFTIFLAVFGAIYEHFSHGVMCPFMMYAFMVPLLMGVLVWLVIGLTNLIDENVVFQKCLNAAIVTFSLGSVIKGMLMIYGTTNRLSVIYWPLGGVFFIIALIAFVRGVINKQR